MFESIMHVVLVIALSMGVIPLGTLLVLGGTKEALDATTTGEGLSSLSMMFMGALLIGSALVALVKGVAW